VHLPLKFAISIPVTVAVALGLAFALVSVAPSRLPMWIKFHQVGGLTLMAGAAGLLLVLPNLAAAFAANRIGGGSWPAFILSFAAVFLFGWLIQVRFLDRGMRVMGGFPATLDFKLGLVLGGNILLCLLVALWISRTPNA
jgi:hypothetical protein